MRLTAKDPACRPDDAAEVAVWAGLLRDGVGVAALRAWPDPPPGRSPAAGWLQRRSVLAYACAAVATLVVIVLASVIGFASTTGPVTASPGSPQDAGAAAPPAASPATSPGRPPAASPVTQREPASAAPGAGAVNPAHGHGYGRDNGGGHGNGHGEGNGNGHGQGNGNDQGNGNGQGD